MVYMPGTGDKSERFRAHQPAQRQRFSTSWSVDIRNQLKLEFKTRDTTSSAQRRMSPLARLPVELVSVEVWNI